MPFEEIIGQERIVRVLKSTLSTQTLPHAYLFYGAVGVGRYKTARAVAKAIFCKRMEADFCGECLDCQRVEKESHPDFIVIRPMTRKGEKEGEVDHDLGEIRIDPVRELQRWISIRSFEGDWRVCVLDGAENLNIQAFNALLKTLEEPPEKSLLILISPTRTQLLPTVLSRCHALYFPPLPGKRLEDILSKQTSEPREDLSLLAALSGGSIGKAIEMDREWIFLRRREWMHRLNDFLEVRSQDSLLDFADDLARSTELMDVLDLYMSWYRDLMVFQGAGETARLLNQDFIQEVEKGSERGSPLQWAGKIDAIRRAKKDIRRHVKSQLVLEGLLLDLGG